MPNFVIQTRQKTDILFPPLPAPATTSPGSSLPAVVPNPSAVPQGLQPLGAGASIGFGPVEIDGYSAISVLAISDQPFTVTFFEGIIPAGPFPVTQTFASVAAGTGFVVAQRFAPVGSYLKMTILNNAGVPETVLSLVVQGVPAA